MEQMTKTQLLQSIEANLLEAYEHLGSALGGEFQRQEGLTCFFTGKPLPLCNGVIRLQTSTQEADARIEAVMEEARRRQVPLTWLLGPLSLPHDLEQRLIAHGWKEDEQVPGMAIALERCETLDAPVPPGFATKEVSDDATMQIWLRVACEGFGFPEPIRTVFFGLYEHYGFLPSSSVRYFLGTLNGEPVGTALLMFGGGLAGIYGIATLPHVRRQGIGAAMTLVAMRAARDAGYQMGTLQATPMGLDVYRRLGWQEYCLFKTYVWQPEYTAATEPPAAPAE